MSDQANQQRKKPDGSAYAAHLAKIAERNVASKKAGREEREGYELERAKSRRETERRQDAGLRKSD